MTDGLPAFSKSSHKGNRGHQEDQKVDIIAQAHTATGQNGVLSFWEVWWILWLVEWEAFPLAQMR